MLASCKGELLKKKTKFFFLNTCTLQAEFHDLLTPWKRGLPRHSAVRVATTSAGVAAFCASRISHCRDQPLANRVGSIRKGHTQLSFGLLRVVFLLFSLYLSSVWVCSGIISCPVLCLSPCLFLLGSLLFALIL